MTYTARYHGQTIIVRGETIQEAANHAGRRLVGAGQVLRVTGTPGLSGMFQVYRPVKGGGVAKYGSNIHVW